jgi:hypothetical protein
LLHGIFLSQQYSCQKVYHSPTWMSIEDFNWFLKQWQFLL